MNADQGGEDRALNAEAQRAIGALDHLVELLRKGAELDRVIDGYLETRRLLAETFKRLAQVKVNSAESLMDGARSKIAASMRTQYGVVAPEELLCVRKYSRTHSLLLAYLAGRVGQSVSASRLRLLTGDQVHTERRIRELRDLGFEIDAGRVSGEFQYCLVSEAQNLEEAASIQLKANIKESKTLSAAKKRDVMKSIFGD